MNVMRRVAQLVLDLNKIQAEAVVRLYGRLGFYRKLYVAAGLPDDVAARLEEKMLGSMFRGIEEQHVLAARWIKGESDLPDFLDRYKDWYAAYLDRCGRITLEELHPAA